MGTTGTLVDGRAVASRLTTPEAPDLHALLAVMRDRGVDACAMEVSSHALVQGRVDAIVNDNLAVLDYLKNTGDTSVEAVAKTGDTSDQVFAFRKDSGLVGPVNDALDELRADGTLAKISEKYFGSEVSK